MRKRETRAQFYETPKVIAARERLYARRYETHGAKNFQLAEEQILLERISLKRGGVKRGVGDGALDRLTRHRLTPCCALQSEVFLLTLCCAQHKAQNNTKYNFTTLLTSSSVHKLHSTTFN